MNSIIRCWPRNHFTRPDIGRLIIERTEISAWDWTVFQSTRFVRRIEDLRYRRLDFLSLFVSLWRFPYGQSFLRTHLFCKRSVGLHDPGTHGLVDSVRDIILVVPFTSVLDVGILERRAARICYTAANATMVVNRRTAQEHKLINKACL